jgi:Uncharacterized protein conserved in bacteria (DUF2188)
MGPHRPPGRRLVPNEIEGEGRLRTAHSTKDAAVAAGRELARARRTEHLIHNIDGTIAPNETATAATPIRPPVDD